MTDANLPRLKEYMDGPYALPRATQQAWILKGVCPKEPGKPRDYSNLVLREHFPVGYLYGPGQAIQPDQVMVRFDAIGACFSDIKIADKGSEHPRMHERDLAKVPAILGHEIALTIVAVGEALGDKYHVGQRCLVNTETIMGGKKVTFGYKYWGAFRQYGVYGRLLLDNDNGSSLIPLEPQNMSYLVAASLEPYACCFNTLNKHRPEDKDNPENNNVKRGGNTLFMGAGTMARALLESILSRDKHPARFAVTDISKERLRRFREVVGRRAEDAGIRVAYLDASDNEEMFRSIDQFYMNGTIDDVFLMFGAPKHILGPVVTGALDRTSPDGVFDVFAGLQEEAVIVYQGVELPIKALHYGESVTLPSGIRIEGFSGLEGDNLREANRGVSSGALQPYKGSVAVVASLDQLSNILHMVEAAQIDGKGILLPHVRQDLGIKTPQELAEVFDQKSSRRRFRDSGIDLDKAIGELREGRMSDHATMLLFEQFLRLKP